MESSDRVLKPTKIKDYKSLFSGVYLDRDNLAGIIRDLGFDIYFSDNERAFFYFNGEKYRIYGKGDSVHRQGDGGEFEHRTFLGSDVGNILISRRFCSYFTSADNYEDYFALEGKDTFILEDNEVTRGISEKINWQKIFKEREC